MNNKIKVLWFANVALTDSADVATGTWLKTMAKALVDSGKVELYNIAENSTNELIRQDCQMAQQWLVPYSKPTSNGLPATKIIHNIQEIVESIQPDLIQIWGTEKYWGLLSARGYLKGKVILEIQGLKFAIAKYFTAGLSFSEIIGCFGLKELLKPSGSILGLSSAFNKWGKFEIEMLKNHQFISTQSAWVRANVKQVNPTAEIYETAISLRKEFMEAQKWNSQDCIPFQIFTSTSSIISYKGLHVLVRALAILKHKYPQVKLVIAGHLQSGLRADGYNKWLRKKIAQLGLVEKVSFIGSLNSTALVKQIQQAQVVAIPSFIESYSLALAEALALGAPTVTSFAGAMPELAKHQETTIFFPMGDEVMCANGIATFFEDQAFAQSISEAAYQQTKEKSVTAVEEIQLSIYNNVLNGIN